MRIRPLLLGIFIMTAAASVAVLVAHYNSEMVSGEQEKNSFRSERWRILQKAKSGLSSPDADTRKRAIYIIGDLEGKELTKHLFNQTLKEEEDQVLRPLLTLIGEWGDETMIPSLIELKYSKYGMYSRVDQAIEKIRARTKS